jgi:hypothetical protein
MRGGALRRGMLLRLWLVVVAATRGGRGLVEKQNDGDWGEERNQRLEEAHRDVIGGLAARVSLREPGAAPFYTERKKIDGQDSLKTRSDDREVLISVMPPMGGIVYTFR